MRNQELIDKFIQHSLTPEETQEFNDLLATSEDFKAEVAFHTDLSAVAEAKEDNEFRELLSSIEVKAQPIQKKSFRKWYIAASIVTIIGLSYVFYPRPMSNDALFASYFEPYRNVTQPIVRGSANEELTARAFNFYENGNYSEALNSFDQIIAQEEDPVISFYKAISLLQLSKLEQAIPIFEKDIDLTDSFTEKRYWYLALAHIKNKDNEAARYYLDQLLALEGNTYKNEEATQLLERLQ